MLYHLASVEWHRQPENSCAEDDLGGNRLRGGVDRTAAVPMRTKTDVWRRYPVAAVQTANLRTW